VHGYVFGFAELLGLRFFRNIDFGFISAWIALPLGAGDPAI